MYSLWLWITIAGLKVGPNHQSVSKRVNLVDISLSEQSVQIRAKLKYFIYRIKSFLI